ncbi:MAG: c-type cytochrome [Rhodospirillaceae bacterium]|nr:c-type cytochrome [Rhodospirillales bacterium]
MNRLFHLAVGLLVAGTAVAAEPPKGSVSGSPAFLASNCANCHGTDGRASDAIPALAGVEKDYFIQAMKEYKGGAREATIMHQLSKGYTDDEIVVLAEYFSNLKP